MYNTCNGSKHDIFSFHFLHTFLLVIKETAIGQSLTLAKPQTNFWQAKTQFYTRKTSNGLLSPNIYGNISNLINVPTQWLSNFGLSLLWICDPLCFYMNMKTNELNEKCLYVCVCVFCTYTKTLFNSNVTIHMQGIFFF